MSTLSAFLLGILYQNHGSGARKNHGDQSQGNGSQGPLISVQRVQDKDREGQKTSIDSSPHRQPSRSGGCCLRIRQK